MLAVNMLQPECRECRVDGKELEECAPSPKNPSITPPALSTFPEISYVYDESKGASPHAAAQRVARKA